VAVWWGAFAASVVIRDEVAFIKPLLVSSVTGATPGALAWEGRWCHLGSYQV
jgi:hypothetical protein